MVIFNSYVKWPEGNLSPYAMAYEVWKQSWWKSMISIKVSQESGVFGAPKLYRCLQESTGYGPLADILIPEDVSMVSSGWSGHNSMEYENWKKKQSVVNYRRNSGFLYIPIYSYIFLYDNYDNILLIQRCMSLVLRSPEKFLHQSQTIHWFKELPLLFDSSIFGQTGPATSCNKGRQTCAYCCSRVQ